jgi:hypothetical protein
VHSPTTFVVRVYRHGFSRMSGIVEDVRKGTKIPFATAEELWFALGKGSKLNSDATPDKRKPLR